MLIMGHNATFHVKLQVDYYVVDAVYEFRLCIIQHHTGRQLVHASSCAQLAQQGFHAACSDDFQAVLP